jgi:hypothetical protein
VLRRRKDLEATSVVTVQNDGKAEHTEVSVERHWSQVPDEVGRNIEGDVQFLRGLIKMMI